MSLPSSRMRPSSGVSKPASIRKSVVLPQPLGPSSAKNSPALISSDSRSTARKAPNFFTTASMLNSGMSAPSACGSGFGNSSAMVPASVRSTLSTDRSELNLIAAHQHPIHGSLVRAEVGTAVAIDRMDPTQGREKPLPLTPGQENWQPERRGENADAAQTIAEDGLGCGWRWSRD